MPPKRRREITIGPVGPWAAIITVDAVETDHGRQTSLPHDHLFELAAEWVGPPAIGFPPSPVPVSARDVVVVTSLQQARAGAEALAEAFRSGGDQPPDPRALVRRNSDASAFPSFTRPI